MKTAQKSSRPLVQFSNKGHKLGAFLKNKAFKNLKLQKKLTTKNVLLQLKLYELLSLRNCKISKRKKENNQVCLFEETTNVSALSEKKPPLVESKLNCSSEVTLKCR